MCLAIPGKIVERREEKAVVDFQGNRTSVSMVLTPEAQNHDWVLVHAGFAITRIDESTALETWSYLKDLNREDYAEGSDVEEPGDA